MMKKIALVGASLCLAACGTTVPLTSQSTVGGAGTGDGLSPGSTSTSSTGTTGGTAIGSTGSTGGTTGLGTSGTGAGGSSGTTGTSGTGGSGTSGSTSGGLVKNGRGITDKTITIGVVLPSNTGAVASAFGISGAGSVDPADMVNAVLSDVNRSGGILGRKLAVYVHSYDATAAISNPAATYAQICSDFRDDHKVFAVMFDLAAPAVRNCLAAAGSPLLMVGGIASLLPGSAYREHGSNYLFGPSSITTERLAKLFIASLVERNFHEKWNTTAGGPGGVAAAKLGLIHVDTPEQNALYGSYASELKKHGLVFSDTVTYEQNASAALAATQSAVLKFRSEGITHIYGASAIFLQYAESQGYRPRYAYLPGLGALGAANSPAAQMKGALSVGWSPATDVNAAQDPGQSAAAKKCIAVMRSQGLSTANRHDTATMFSLCDSFYAFRAALVASKLPTLGGLRAGYEGLGSSFGTAYAFSALLRPNQHYGVDTVRDMAYDSACSCLIYTAKTNRA